MPTFDPLTLAGAIQRHCASLPDFEVLTVDGGGRRADDVRTYSQLWRRALTVAGFLRRLGAAPGQSFGLLMANHIEMTELMVASSLLGTVFVPIDPRTKGERLAFMLESADCVGVVCADYALTAVREVRDNLPALRWIACLATDESQPGKALNELADVHAFPIETASGAATDAQVHGFPGSEADWPMQLIYTSGTTGDPKGIVMTHRRYGEAALVTPKLCGYLPDDRLYNGLSLTHANAQMFTLAPALFNAIPCVLSRRFSKSRLWDICRRHGSTTFTLLGGMTTAIYAEPPRDDDADNPVRMVLASGMPASIWADFERRFGVKVSEVYGAAEGGITFNPSGVGPIGSIGKPVATLKHRVVDDEGVDCPRGVPGELIFRPADGSPAQVQYYRNRQASAAKCKDGWLRMGDIVVEDENGWLFFQHRKGAGIRRNGEFINTAYIEKALAEMPGIDDVYVYGTPSVNGVPGERDVVAAIVPKDFDNFDPQLAFARCRSALEPSHVPGRLQVLRQIPKTASEKPQDRFLIDALQSAPESVFVESRATNPA